MSLLFFSLLTFPSAVNHELGNDSLVLIVYIIDLDYSMVNWSPISVLKVLNALMEPFVLSLTNLNEECGFLEVKQTPFRISVQICLPFQALILLSHYGIS